jgi:predicted CXXCH cytochrome family protein
MIAASILLAAAVAVQAPETCTLCHPDVRVQHEQSVHHAEGVTCTSCHGGNPSATGVEAAHRGGFRGVPRRRDIPALCATCHADIARMRPYNLPSDQYALYQTSQHGLLLAKGDERVAVCTDCHGVHDIRPPQDPLSHVFARNIPQTCGRCHGDTALMARYGLKGNAYQDYVAGVHGVAFLQRNDAAAPQCARCHGAHGATPPGVGDVDKVCGQCHAAARAAFLEGPHKKAMDAAGLPECASCHDHHRILPVTAALLDRVCLDCHAEGSEPQQRGAAMQALFTQASEAIDTARAQVERAAAIPLYVEDYRARLEDARTALVGAAPVTHGMDVGRVQEMTRRARSIAGEVSREIEGKIEGRLWRRVGLLLFWFYLLLTVALLLRYRKRAAAEAPR